MRLPNTWEQEAILEHRWTGMYAMWEIQYPDMVPPNRADHKGNWCLVGDLYSGHGWLSAETHEKYRDKVDKCNHEVNTWRENCARIFDLIIQHCDPELCNLLRLRNSGKRWRSARSDNNIASLINMIRNIML